MVKQAKIQTPDEGFQLFASKPATSALKDSEAKASGTKKTKGLRDDGAKELRGKGAKEPRGEAASEVKSKGARSKSAAPSAPEPQGIFKGDLEERDFGSLGLDAWLVESCSSVGLSRPTDIQWNCIPPTLQGRDMVASAETGSGKTAAFALPILQLLSRDPYGVFALILTPTRELAFQIQDQFTALGSRISLKQSVVVGGMDMMVQAVELCARPHVVVATPGRMADHIKSSIGVKAALRRVKFLVLDEADRLLEPCFDEDLGTILPVLPSKRITQLFSATITSSIEEVKKFSMKNCFEFAADDPKTTVAGVTEQYAHMPLMVKDCYLLHIIRESKAKALILFAGTKKTCQYLTLLLEELGEEVTAIHSGLKQNRRMASLDKFKGGRTRILVATDVASRGLDIPQVELVINYDLPQASKDYIHRVGRTARAGRTGKSIALVTQYDVELVHNIEESTNKQLEDANIGEDVVLTLMPEVMKAKRLAKVKMLELDSEGQEDKRRAGLKRKRD